MPRFDTLTPIHKALRALVYEVGGDLQTSDFADEMEAAGAAADLELALHLMRDHHTTEEVYVYPKLQPLEEQLVASMLEQHGDVERLLDVADAARRQMRAGDAEDRILAGADVNCRFNELVAFYFEHLAQEEAKVLPATWRHFDDAQLMAIQGTIIAEMDPDQLFQWLGWMFKGLNRVELVGMLRGAKAGMPPEALEAVRGLGAATMEPAAWQVVRDQAGL
ncbi:MAG: hemerythrin domain-containing protein [Deltaproteobacteria bacterium]